MQYAKENNFDVVTKITLDLNFLVCGDKAGPKKLELAKQQGVSCLTEKEFYNPI